MICNNFLSLTYTEFITNEFWNVHSNKLWNRTGLHHCVIWKILEVMNYSYIYHPLWLHLGVRNFLDIQREEQVFGLYNWLVHPVPRSMHSKVFKPSSPPFSPCRHLWVANKQCVCVCVCMLSHFSCVWFYVILWTVACQGALSMRFSRREYWSGLSLPSPGEWPLDRSLFLLEKSISCTNTASSSLELKFTLVAESCDPVNPCSTFHGIAWKNCGKLECISELILRLSQFCRPSTKQKKKSAQQPEREEDGTPGRCSCTMIDFKLHSHS